jgi:hypothetical protein
MTRFELDAVASANPLPSDAAERLTLHEAEQEMLEAILAQSVPAPLRHGARRRWTPGRRLGAVGAAAAAVLALLAVWPLGHDGGGPSSALAQLVRFANASPLVLLDAHGWEVIYANEDSAREGELRFQLGGAPRHLPVSVGALVGRQSDLAWRAGTLSDWIRDRAASAMSRSTARVLGTTAQVFQYRWGRPGDRDITALWEFGGRVLEYRAEVRDLAAFDRQLSALRRVDSTTWLLAMPANVVKTPNRHQVVAQMLQGIPLPPGFTAAQIGGSQLTNDRYQLGAAVSGTVACTWFALWSHARQTGDHTGVQRAVAAMATAGHWLILRQMAAEGDYPGVLIAYACDAQRPLVRAASGE